MFDLRNPGADGFYNLIAVSAGVVWALGVILVKRLQVSESLDLLNFSFWQMLVGLIPIVGLLAVSHQPPVHWTTRFVFLLLFIGVAGTAGGWLMWLYVLKHLPAGTTGKSSLGIPVVALVGSAIHLGERPSASELTGMGFIIGALAPLSFDTIGRQRESVPLMIPE